MDDDEFERDLGRNSLRSDSPPEGAAGWSVGRVLSGGAVLVMIGFWVWAFSPLAPRGNADELDDPAFSEFAEVRCSAAVEAVRTQVPPAAEAADAQDRGEQIQASTDIFAVMLEDLAANAPDSTSRDGELVSRWLNDWGIYLQDRYDYAADFRSGLDQAFAVTAVNRDQVTGPLDFFATINRMPSCASPQDV